MCDTSPGRALTRRTPSPSLLDARDQLGRALRRTKVASLHKAARVPVLVRIIACAVPRPQCQVDHLSPVAHDPPMAVALSREASRTSELHWLQAGGQPAAKEKVPGGCGSAVAVERSRFQCRGSVTRQH